MFLCWALIWNCLGTCAPVPCCKKSLHQTQKNDLIIFPWPGVCASNFSRTSLKKAKWAISTVAGTTNYKKSFPLGKTLFFAVSTPCLFFLAHGMIMYLASGDELEFVRVTSDCPVSSFLAFLLSKGESYDPILGNKIQQETLRGTISGKTFTFLS